MNTNLMARWASVPSSLAGILSFFTPWVEIMEEVGTGLTIARFDKAGEWTQYSLVWLSPLVFGLILLAAWIRKPMFQLVLSVAATAGPLIALWWVKRTFSEHWKYLDIKYGTWLTVGCAGLCTACALIRCVTRPTTASK